MSSGTMLGKMFDEYRIEQPLGEGGMAHVYRALDTKLRRYAALKVIAPKLRTDEDYAKRFQREAQSIARLEHPNIVNIYRFGEVNEMYYIAMQYIEGADIAQLIRDYRKSREIMPIADIVQIVTDVAAALDYMHKKGVIHRDIKPGNIMVTSEGRAIVTDFGLVLVHDEGTRGEIFGSPLYIAPEQAISSAKVVPQSDLYALGVTLFEMVTGQVPFASENPMDVALRHLTDTPSRPSSLNKSIPSALDDVILRILAKQPHDRYRTGAEFSTALAKAAEAWQKAPAPRGRNAHRLSSIIVSKKVKQSIAESPLPPLPPLPPLAQRPARVKSAPIAAPSAKPSAAPSAAPPAAAPKARSAKPRSAKLTKANIENAQTFQPPAPKKGLWALTGIAILSLGFIAMMVTQSAQPSSPSSDGRKFVIFHNENMLYMANQSGKPIPIANISFERLLTNGETGEQFTGVRWANYYEYLEARKCMIVKVTGGAIRFPQQDCPSGHNVELIATAKERFWTPKNGSTEFRVLWLKQEVARCQIAAQRCDVWLPEK